MKYTLFCLLICTAANLTQAGKLPNETVNDLKQEEKVICTYCNKRADAKYRIIDFTNGKRSVYCFNCALLAVFPRHAKL